MKPARLFRDNHRQAPLTTLGARGCRFFQGKAQFGELHPTASTWCSAPTKLAEAGDVLISIRAPVGPTNVAAEPCCIGRGLAALRALGGVDQRYVLFWLRYTEAEWSKIATGSTFAAISGAQLAQHAIAVAPEREQRRVIAEIDRLFLETGLASEALERVKRRVSYIRQSALQIAAPSNPPSSWRRVSWREVGRSQNGRFFPSKAYSEAGIRLLRPGNLFPNGTVQWTEENTRYLPRRWAEQFPNFLVGPDQLIMNLTAQSLKDEFLGRVSLTGPDTECLLNQRLCRLESEAATKPFLLYLFKSPHFRRFVDGLNTGSLIQHMFTSQLDSFEFLLPTLEDQQEITREIERCLTVLAHLESTVHSSLVRAQGLRQAILKKAFEGQLVPQDPKDEPASALLERIRATRAHSGSRPRAVR